MFFAMDFPCIFLVCFLSLGFVYFLFVWSLFFKKPAKDVSLSLSIVHLMFSSQLPLVDRRSSRITLNPFNISHANVVFCCELFCCYELIASMPACWQGGLVP